MLSVVPTSAAVDATVSLGELFLEGKFFSVPGTGLTKNDPGGEYLNYAFGIAPVLADVEGYNKTIKDFDKILTQWYKDADKVVRRKTKRFVTEEETTTTVRQDSATFAPMGINPLTYDLVGPNGKLTITTTIKREVWYSGAFKYYIPKEIDTLGKLILEYNRAYGVLPSPADVWEILPFSWLIDWFSNAGNAVRHAQLQSSEGATQIYGYVMCETQVEQTREWSGHVMVNGSPQPRSITNTILETIRQRERVSPFGVTLTGVDLSPRQLAILAALGVSK